MQFYTIDMSRAVVDFAFIAAAGDDEEMNYFQVNIHQSIWEVP
jgi:hypothetical protein